MRGQSLRQGACIEIAFHGSSGSDSAHGSGRCRLADEPTRRTACGRTARRARPGAACKEIENEHAGGDERAAGRAGHRDGDDHADAVVPAGHPDQ